MGRKSRLIFSGIALLDFNERPTRPLALCADLGVRRRPGSPAHAARLPAAPAIPHRPPRRPALPRACPVALPLLHPRPPPRPPSNAEARAHQILRRARRPRARSIQLVGADVAAGLGVPARSAPRFRPARRGRALARRSLHRGRDDEHCSDQGGRVFARRAAPAGRPRRLVVLPAPLHRLRVPCTTHLPRLRHHHHPPHPPLPHLGPRHRLHRRLLPLQRLLPRPRRHRRLPLPPAPPERQRTPAGPFGTAHQQPRGAVRRVPRPPIVRRRAGDRAADRLGVRDQGVQGVPAAVEAARDEARGRGEDREPGPDRDGAGAAGRVGGQGGRGQVGVDQGPLERSGKRGGGQAGQARRGGGHGHGVSAVGPILDARGAGKCSIGHCRGILDGFSEPTRPWLRA